MADRLLHASGFMRDGWPNEVKITSYDGTIEQVVPGIFERIEADGHDVKFRRTWPLGGGPLVKIDATVLVMRDGEQIGKMWHVFAYESDKWPSVPKSQDVQTGGDDVAVQ